MMLMTKAIEKALPPLYANEDKDASEVPIIVKFFNPMGAATWWITEGSKQEDGDWLLFGYADLYGQGAAGGAELGYISLNELAALKLPLGLGIERDRHYGAATLADVMEGKG